MAVISRRLGQVISTTPRVRTQASDPFDPTGGTTGSGDTLVGTGTTSGLGSILSGQAAKDRAALEAQKYADERAAAAATLARQQAGAQAQEAYLKSQLGAGIPTQITGEITAQEEAGKQYIQSQAEALLKQLQARAGEARGLTTTGFSNLQNYLARTQPTAFAQAQRAMPTVTESQLGQYMAGQGVSPAAAQEAARLANIQAAGGASNYNQLLNVLAAREQAAQQSRQAEAEMGLASQLANLQALYGTGESQLEQQRLGALAELARTISAARLQAAQQQAAREQAIRDALAALYGTGYVKPPVEGKIPGRGTVTADEALATLNQLAPTNPAAPVDMMLRNIPPADEVAALIALAQQSPQYTGGGGGLGAAMGNQAVMF